MSRCAICGETFLGASMSGPAEPCGCGADLTRTDLRELPPDEVEERRQAWADRQKDDEATNGPDGWR